MILDKRLSIHQLSYIATLTLRSYLSLSIII
nr:MAG TPA: hypothetical protein [Caudoviricetes sp.]